MIYSLTLGTAFLLTGLVLFILHGLGFWKSAAAQAWLKAFPRSKGWGVALLAVASIWFWLLVTNIDLGEFSNWRLKLQVIVPVAAFLTWRYVDEFLSVRSLGMIVLLAAEPLLEAAWMRPESGRLFLIVLVYIYIVAAMFWIGTPYVLRDHIAWVTKSESRWRAAALAGMAYGAVLLILSGLTLRHSS